MSNDFIRRNFDRQPGRTLQGFTLIELIVVAVLTSILMAAVASTMTSILRTRLDPANTATRAVRKQMQRDLMNAVYFRFADGRLDLLGPIALDSEMQPVWQDAEVSYRLEPFVTKNREPTGLLLRTQTPAARVGARVGQGVTRNRSQAKSDPVWLGVSNIQFDTNYLIDENTSGLSTNRQSVAPAASEWRILPATFRVRILNDAGEVWLSESIVGNGI